MSADELRQAAATLRERAAASTPGPWTVVEDWAYIASGSDSVIHGYYEGDCGSCGEAIQDDASVSLSEPDADYIATVHPDVGLALADLLDMTAMRAEDVGTTILKQSILAAALPGIVLAYNEALALARLINGGAS